MADNAETGRGNNDEATKAIEAGEAMAKKAIEKDAKKGPNVKDAQEDLAKEYLKKLKDVHDEAMRFSRAKTQEEKDKEKEKGKKAQKILLEAASAAKQGIKIADNPQANALLSQFAEKKLTAETASAIQDYFGDFLFGGKKIILQPPDQPKSDFQKAYERLREQDKAAAERVIEAIAKKATIYGVENEDQVRERLQPEKSQESTTTGETIEQQQRYLEDQRRQGREKFDDEGTWENDEAQYYGRFTVEQRNFLHDLYSANKFLDRLETEVKKVKADTLEEKREIASKSMIRQVNTIMTQLYVNLQLEAPKKFYEEIAQEDYFSGIVPTTAALKRNLGRVLFKLQQLEEAGDERAKNMKMYIDSEEKTYTIEKEITFDRITGKKIEKDVKLSKPVSRLEPLTRAKAVGVSNFMTSVINNLNHLQHRQEYFHNVRALFNQPAHGEQGFYGQLAGYAEKLSGTDIDEIMLLPDGPLVYEAFILYDKLVEEDFAKLDWKHRPNQFSNQLERVNSQLENEVFDLLKQDHGGKYSDIELRNALNIAVGMSRGVFMNEPEKSAYADAVDAEGKGMIASYGTNDAAALTPFNPLHLIMRWQGESVVTPYYFLPINRMDKGEKMSWKAWDHNKLWDAMLKYKNSYTQGRGDLADKELLIDKLIDVCNVGGPAKRRGWRMLYTTKDYYEYYEKDENGNKKGEMNVLKTFKALENIGYEVINDFFDNQIPDGFKNAAIKGEKLEFFKYLYQNYFEGFEDGDLNNYLDSLRKEQRIKAINDIKKRLKSPKSIDEQTEINVTNEFVMRALSYEIAWRFPSKLLKMDRDRFQKDGISRWRNIQKQSGLSRDDFDVVMKDLAFAETLLRKEMSEDMRKIVEKKVRIDPKFRLCDLGEIDNKLTEAKIEDLLRNKISEGKISEVKRIYKLIEKTYLRDKKFMKEEIGPKIDDYTFTFGLEDTDFSFMVWRGAGPRIIPRAIGDIGRMERDVIPGIIDMPWKLHEMAVNGKHDFSPVIEYLKKARQAFWEVHGPGDQMDEFMYQIAASTIAYFKKDTVAKPLFGLFGIGRKNSLAAQVAGRSTAVWEWDSRDIDRFCVALESNHLLRNAPYDLAKQLTDKPIYEPLWLNIFGKAVKTPFKKRVIDFKWNSKRLRKEFGASGLHIAWEIINNYLPIVMAYLAWLYIKKSLEEAEGKKK